MRGVIIEAMPDNRDVQRDKNSTKGLFRVVIVEQDEKGRTKKGGQSEVRAESVPYDRAFSIANDLTQQLQKASDKSSDE
jgi:hypothetical protein